ncbi:Imm45 family immunity protein [Aestuariivirga sp.]|uniref:Imm45 family immunity protein n=1 Tax=Aestuariivirga sp. TaxID=2650926 RepID=UPI0039E50943
MKWLALTACGDAPLGHGALLRCPGSYPHECVVDLLVYDPNDAGRGMGLMVDSGYKAGLALVILPLESGAGRSIDPHWLRQNWKSWVYPSSALKDVWVCRDGRRTPRLPQKPPSVSR